MKGIFSSFIFCFVAANLSGQISISFDVLENMPGPGRDDAVAFVAGQRAYAGLGSFGPNGGFEIKNDLWRYNHQIDTWSQVDPLPGAPRQYAMSFSYLEKGIVFGGHNNSAFFDELWTFSEVSSWQLISLHPGGARAAGAGFILEDELYIGTGRDDALYYNDFWKYNFTTGMWTELPPFPGGLRFETIGFVRNGNGYLGMGRDENLAFKNDLWEFDPLNQSWEEVCSFDEAIAYSKSEFKEGRALLFGGQTASSALSSKAFILDQQCQTYEFESGLEARRGCASFQLEDDCYFFGGLLENGQKSNQLVRLTLEEESFPTFELISYTWSNKLFFDAPSTVEEIHIYDSKGMLVAHYMPNANKGSIDLENATNGIYLIRIRSDKSIKSYKALVISN
ncbi:MAG: kelch repeat-containing protein [Bacteroidota bacterium]